MSRLGRRRSRAPPAAADGAAPALRSEHLNIADRYLALAFRLAKHEPELVGDYYGPTDPLAAVDAEEPLEPARLVEEAESLLEELGRSDLERQRRAWLTAQTRALLTVALRLDGHRFSYADEVEGIFGIRPRWYDESDYEQAHVLLDEALPGAGPIAPRYARWFDQAAVPAEALLPALRSVSEELRARTDELVGLPDGEALELELVSGEPWGGHNSNLGGLRSRISINTDLPFSACDLGYLVAHEGYPGHHVDSAWKEQILVHERGQLEETLTVYAPEAVLAEGIAELGADLVLGEQGDQELNACHLTAVGFDYDPELGAAVYAAQKLLRTVWSNLALLLKEHGASTDELRDYARRWSLQPEERIEKMVDSLSRQRFPGYQHCYPEGHRLCAAFVRGDPARFKRLLTEQLVPNDL